jgi:uncharacterized protein Smg (DUF494 family)
VLHLLRTQTDHATGLQFDSDEVVALLRSLDVALSHIRQVLEMMTANLAASETAAAPFASSAPYP